MGPSKIEKSAAWTIVGIVVLFSTAVFVTLIAPRHVDSSWTTPSSDYQVQMYTIADPNFYISSAATKGQTLEFLYHLKAGFTLLSFQENEGLRIVAPKELESYVTRLKDPLVKLTSRLLLLRPPQDKKETGVLELYDPMLEEAFALATTEGILESWVDKDFQILDPRQPYHHDKGVIFVKNPEEYRVKTEEYGWRYDPQGERIHDLASLGFRSRAELIKEGEHIYAIEGCWNCHTDQTRTLVQDLVLNGSDSYPAPPSSASEYVFQEITFPGTRRIGPDMSRVGVKRASRDWHKGHFWSPKTASKGSIMPPFKHFFDEDPSGKLSEVNAGIPNQQFEAIYQYLMTKGTRITPPTQAWWLGKDPIQAKLIIEGKKTLKP